MSKSITNIQDTSIKTTEKAKNINDILINLFCKSGQEYFDGLALFLSEITNSKYVIIGKYNENNHCISAQTFYANKKYIKNYSYNLKHTPCEIVISSELCVYPNNIQELFPKDVDLKSFGIESYIGLPLFNVNNSIMGIVVIMDEHPMQKVKENKKILKLIESKTELELERISLKEQHILSQKDFINSLENFQDVFFQNSYNSKLELIDIVVSPSSKKMFGYDSKTSSHPNINDLYANDEDRKIVLEKLKKEKSIKNYPAKFKKINGEIIRVEIDAQLIVKSKNDDVAFIIRGVLKDVTDKYKENLRLEIAYLIAQKSKRRLTNINLLSEFIYKTLLNIMDISNFYIALHDVNKNELDLPIYIDEKESKSISQRKIPYANSLTEYIIESKKPLIKDKKGLEDLTEKKSLKLRGELPECFVGVPLKSEGICFGVMVMQNYQKDYHFNNEDIDLLSFIATQFAYVIERTQWQEFIIKKEEHYRSLVENSSEIIGIINTTGIIQYISESSKKIIGFKPSELIGEQINTFIKADNFLLELKETIKTLPKDNHKILYIINKKNEKKYLDIYLSKKGKKEIIFNAKDITNTVIANKKKEIAQRDLEERNDDLTDIFNYSSEGIIKTNATGKFLFVNKRLCEILGYTEKELLDKDFRDITYPPDLKHSEEIFDKIQREKITEIKFDKKYIHKNGNIINCHVVIKWTFEVNEANNTSFVFITDKTKERNAFKQIYNLKKALDLSANVLLTDTDGIIIDANKKVSELSGYLKEELVGKSMSIFDSDYFTKKDWELFWSSIKSGNVWQDELRNKSKDGSYYWLFTTIVPVFDNDGKIDQYLTIQFDITEEKKIKSNSIKEVIEAQERERERFAMEIHDGLGQVLLATKMNLNALQDSADELNLDSKNILNTSIDLLNDAVHEARNVSHGLMSRVLKQFGLSKAIEEIVDNTNKSTKLGFTFTHNIKNVRFDEEIEMGIYRTLQELIKNIISHAKASLINLEVIKEDNQLTIEIKDDGIGISEEKVKNSKSNGIGLRNMKSRIEYLGGTFTIDNKIKIGTRITIIISF